MGMTYQTSCVGFPQTKVHTDGGLMDMIGSAVSVTRATFLRHVDRENLREIEAGLGYEAHPSRGLTMAGDWHVSYHRSKLFGKRVYYFRQSAIEHIFA